MKRNPSGTRVVVFSVLLAALGGCDELWSQTRNMTQPVADQEPVADHVITEQVVHKLDKELFLREGMIRVDTRAGTVLLSGYVACEDDRNRAEELVGSVAGVKSIQSTISVLQLEPGCLPASGSLPEETRSDLYLSI